MVVSDVPVLLYGLFGHDCGSENAMKTHLTLCFQAWNADASHTQNLAKLARRGLWRLASQARLRLGQPDRFATGAFRRPRYLTSNVDQIAFNLRRGLRRSYVSPRLCKRASLFVRDSLPFNQLMRNFKRHFVCYEHKGVTSTESSCGVGRAEKAKIPSATVVAAPIRSKLCVRRRRLRSSRLLTHTYARSLNSTPRCSPQNIFFHW